jgi:iron complex outermembrane receptor protein
LSFGCIYQAKAFIPSSINETDFNNSPQKLRQLVSRQDLNPTTKLLGVGYEQQLGNHGYSNPVFLLIIKAFEPRPFDILDDQSSSVGLRSTLNYKRTMVAFRLS